MATSVSARISRTGKKMEKPRPLNLTNAGMNRHSVSEVRLGTTEEIMQLIELVAANLANGNYDIALKMHIKNLHNVLKVYGSKLESIYKDQLDRSFVAFRNGSRDEGLDFNSRILLLELIELRATQWSGQDSTAYYKYKANQDDLTPTADTNLINSLVFSPINMPLTPISPAAPVQQLILGPGELVKSSGKYPAPTRVVGKNYCKDEIVIRNSDSGKVMGIKGRRVHMIEELSETVISFQRVNPGAKERLVQITGPTEEKINYAEQLIEETIRRNASPVRAEVESERPASTTGSLTDSDDSLYHSAPRASLLHSFSTSDACLGEYKYTVAVGDENIKITGANLELVRTAKLVLDQYFSPDANDEYVEFSSEEGQDIFEHIEPAAVLDNQKPAAKKAETKSMTDLPSNQNYLANAGLRCYTPVEIIRYADSPLSRIEPDGWSDVHQQCPCICRKVPIEWVTAAALLKSRIQDAIKRGGSASPSEVTTIVLSD